MPIVVKALLLSEAQTMDVIRNSGQTTGFRPATAGEIINSSATMVYDETDGVSSANFNNMKLQSIKRGKSSKSSGKRKFYKFLAINASLFSLANLHNF